MRITKVRALIGSLVVLLLAACGGGGGGVASQGGRLLSGTASKGPIAGGTVKVFQVISSSTLNPRLNIPRYGSTPVAQGTTAGDGSYSVTLPAGLSSGSIMVQITGGSYTDESTGVLKKVDDEYGASGMRAVYSNLAGVIQAGGVLSVSVTPYTELAVEDAGEHATDAAIAASNGKVAAAFNLPDLVATKPLDPNKPFPATGSDDARKYALALATLSQYQHDYGAGASMAQISAALVSQLATGGLTPETSTRMGASGNNYAGGSRNPNAALQGADNPNAPAAIHTAPSSPVSSSIGTPVTISAHAAKGDGTAVPDGTLIGFRSNFGTLSASSAPTVNGFATVTLSSAVVGSAQVSASYGALSDSAATITFVDPNAPAGITMSANASQGVTTGPAVLLSANVSRAAGGPVPDGTVVSFSVVSGSGSLSGATTTSNGIATVNLSSSVGGASVGVQASVGGISQVLNVPFIVQPTQAIVKLSTGGTLSGNLIGGINAVVNYSGGKGLSIIPGNVTASGVAAGSTLIPNTNNAGQVILGLLNVTGVPVGEFATLRFAIAAGNFPTAADFAVASSSSAIDVNTVSLPGISIAISSVVIQ